MAAGIPVALIIALVVPALWAVGAAWAAGIIGLILFDAMLALPSRFMTPSPKIPARLYVGTEGQAHFLLKDLTKRPPRVTEFKLSANERIKVTPNTTWLQNAKDGKPEARFDLSARRRGDGILQTLWARWQGPLGLIWMQRQDPIDHVTAIVPNTQLVKDTAINFFSRDAAFGQKIQALKGEGSEFDSLAEFLPGMDKRAIDWKHSARHNTLLAREYRTERNHNIVFALDSGYLMCADMVDSEDVRLTKLDRAIASALIMGYVSLKMGDRVGIFGFDKSPNVYSPPVSGTSLFAGLQNETSKIDYSNEETNYTFGLSFLAQKLRRRSLIVVFTDFVDTTQSELMLETVARLLKRHIVIFVAFKNQPLTELSETDPKETADISRAVIAKGLLSERELVLAKLTRMGVDVIDVNPDTLNTDLVNSYLALKRKGAI